MIVPGPRNSLTDVAGLSVGNAHDPQAWSGVTVVLSEQRLRARGAPEGTATEIATWGVPFGLVGGRPVALWRGCKR